MLTARRRTVTLPGAPRAGGLALGLLGAIAAACVLALAPVAAAQQLERQIRDLITRSKVGQADVAVCVVDAATGEVLAGVNEQRAMIPASNLKVLTSGSALLALGKDFEFRTRLVLDGNRLVVIGSGDPGFADPELLKDMNLSVGAFVDRLVESVRQAGASGIAEVVIDDRVFDRQIVHPSWPSEQLHRWYCAEVWGFNFHTNVLQVFATGGNRAGVQPTVRTEPSAGWIELVNNATTVTTGSSALGVVRGGQPGRAAQPAGSSSFRFLMSGTVRNVAMDPVEVTFTDPGLMFGRLLADRLAAASLSAAGATPSVRYAGDEERIDSTRVVAVVRTPLAVALKRCNASSHNLYAEALLKRVGHEVTSRPGSWENGAAVVRMQIAERLGADAGSLVMADGSGLSRENRVTARLLATWMAMIARLPDGAGQAYVDSMAVPGEGSWSNRFRDLTKLQSDFHGKSGFINNVLSLSGFVTHAPSGRRVVVSILVNRTNEAPPGKVREFQESVVEQLDRFLARSSGARPAVGG